MCSPLECLGVCCSGANVATHLCFLASLTLARVLADVLCLWPTHLTQNAYKEKKMAMAKMEMLEKLRVELSRKRTQQGLAECALREEIRDTFPAC